MEELYTQEILKNLIYKGKKHTKPLHHAKVSAISDRVDISERPEIINNCEEDFIPTWQSFTPV